MTTDKGDANGNFVTQGVRLASGGTVLLAGTATRHRGFGQGERAAGDLRKRGAAPLIDRWWTGPELRGRANFIRRTLAIQADCLK